MAAIDRIKVKKLFEKEIAHGKKLERNDEYTKAFHHYERAHILSQRWLLRHWQTHWLMLRLATKCSDTKEIVGQIKRLLAVPIGWATGWVPKGNTGGSNVSALKPMALPDDLDELMHGFSVWKDVAVRCLIVLIICVVWLIYSLIADVREYSGENLEIALLHPTHCEQIGGMPASEDIVVMPDKKHAISVGGDRRLFRTSGTGSSRIWMFPLEDPTQSIELKDPSISSLQGFGADVVEAPDGSMWLLIANRGGTQHSVYVYKLLGDYPSVRLTFSHELSAPGFRNPNDLVAISPTRALVTLDKVAPAGSVLEVLEGAFRFPSGRLVEIGNGEIDELVSGFQSANGITRLEDGTLVIGELVGRRISVLAPIEQVKNKTRYTIQKRISLPFAVDNLSSLDNSNVLVTGHPKLLTLATKYQFNEKKYSPSQVASVDIRTGTVRTLYRDRGTSLSGSSVAVSDEADGFIVGSAFGPNILHCKNEMSVQA